MWVGVRRPYPQGQVCDLGGSVGRNRFVYDPVKAWSTASWSAVDVVLGRVFLWKEPARYLACPPTTKVLLIFVNTSMILSVALTLRALGR